MYISVIPVTSGGIEHYFKSGYDIVFKVFLGKLLLLINLKCYVYLINRSRKQETFVTF